MERKMWTGKRLIIIGVSLLLVALLSVLGIFSYTWWTNAVERRAQAELQRRWNDAPQATEVNVGDGIARIVIPKLGLDAIVVELSGLDDVENLKRGPGHIPGTAYPGGGGNVVISGHRTTYGAPFRYINELLPGDEIILEVPGRAVTYQVTEQRIIEPTDLSVLAQGTASEVTLTACHPWYSAEERIIVVAQMVSSSNA